MANNIYPDYSIYKAEGKGNFLKQNPVSIWLIGLSGAGKSTIAKELDKFLLDKGFFSCILDGDNIRYTINRDLGFSEADRKENIRRVAEINNLFLNNGVIVINSFIIPAINDRQLAKEIIGENFLDIYIDCPLDVCIERDVKGLYKKALNNEVANFAGVHYQYEPPVNPFLTIKSNKMSVEESVSIIYKSIIGHIKL